MDKVKISLGIVIIFAVFFVAPCSTSAADAMMNAEMGAMLGEEKDSMMGEGTGALMGEDKGSMMNDDAMMGNMLEATAEVEAIAQGVAEITGTQEGSNISGTVKFTETVDGLKVEAELFNVPNPGKHGFHIHEVGSCVDVGKAAGGHYNPDNVQHGMLEKDGHTKAHAGDMGNIEIDATGHGKYSGVLPEVTLSGGKYPVDGKTVILHEKEDDFGQPTGNAGGRIGCGIISVSK